MNGGGTGHEYLYLGGLAAMGGTTHYNGGTLDPHRNHGYILSEAKFYQESGYSDCFMIN